MSIQVIKQENQAIGSFNSGEIIENKPIGFPQDRGMTKPYSNLFYWAHAESEHGSTIGLHPHKGFEIISYVLSGSIRHYDTKTDKWWDLEEGDFQVIKSGNGISHSEELGMDSEIFQIWLDPNLSKSLSKPAEYRDYTTKDFPIESNEHSSVKTIVGLGSDVNLDTEGIEIEEITFKNEFTKVLKPTNTYSIYILKGALELNNQQLHKNDFAIITGEENVSIEGEKDSKLFILSSPNTASYKTYINS